jgi:uncharacterized protein (TIGR02271 family)
MITNRIGFLSRFPGIREGLPVYSRDGESLGKVVGLSDDFIEIEKGLFFPKNFTVRYDDINDIRDDSVYLSLAANELSEWRSDAYVGWEQADRINTGSLAAEPRTEFRDRYSDWSSEEVKVPVVEEQLEAKKTSESAGSLRLRKIVHTELKHFTVPVMREEVRVERVPVADREAGSAPTADSFSEKTIDIPVMEEKVTVTKRPVVKEEVRVTKERVTVDRDVSGEIRKEEVRVEGEEELKRRKAG